MTIIYNHHIENDICVITVMGEIGEDLCRYIEECLTHYLKGVVINLKKLEKLNSSAFGMLMQVDKKLRSYQVKLAICELSAGNARLFQNTLLGEIIDVYAIEGEAIKSVLNATDP
ncbi:MAG: STAS domain-containing protein [SAR324 cluster bacterium]|nr:STAS domain-containing protein [SAR324 cluster bacterium]